VCAVIAGLFALGACNTVLATETLQLKLQRELGTLTPADATALPTFIFAQEVSGNPDDKMYLKRDAEVRRTGSVLKADDMIYDVREDTVRAFGNTRIIKEGIVITGPSLSVRASTSAGNIEKPNFFLQDIGGVGKANMAEFNGVDKLKLFQTSYTTCRTSDIESADWYVQADTLDLNLTDEEGNAKDGKVIFKGVPILKASSLDFPLKNKRKSGFLPPTVSFTTRSGLELLSPYYLDIAPNRDFTFMPRLLATRGLQYGGQFRYLEPEGSGDLRFERLETDRQTNTTRYSLLGRGTQNLNNGWVGGYNLAKVSDDKYFVDFSRTLVGASQRNLPQDVYLTRSQPNYNLTTRITRFQTLQDPANPVAVPYNRVPQILLNAEKLDVSGLDFSLLTEAARFSHPTQIDGSRMTLRPSVSYPMLSSALSITPRISLQSVAYQLNRLPGSASDSTPLSQTNSVPIFSLDNKLFMEKTTSFRGRDYIQTLEPRVFLLYVPYRNQDKQPLFDTAMSDFNYTQIFSENRFAGLDRVGDAKQVTLAASSRFLDPQDGSELIRLFAGQRFSMADQRVTTTGTTALTDTKTDFLLGASGQVSKILSVEALTQISAKDNTVNRGNITVRYRPGENRVINTSYRYTRDALNQIDVSGQYPLGGRWYGVGRINYSFRESRYIETIAGFEYDGGCWASRVVTQSFASSTGTRTATVLLQLELNGFSKIGSDPMALLRRAVPGYAPINTSSSFNPNADISDRFSDYQ